MKWIGQHIWSFISRFRSDVYLESLSTTTETNVLVVDSAGKVSKSTSVAGDLTSIVAGTGLSGTSLTGPIPTLNVDAAQTQITSVGTLTALTVDNINIDGDEIRATGDLTITATGNDINVDTDNFTITSAIDVKPVFTLKSTTNSNKGSLIDFVSDKGAAGADNDIIGTVNFYGDTSAQEQILFGKIQSKVNTAADTDESGEMQLLVTKSNGTADNLGNGIKLTGHGTNDTVSAEIGAGVASTTTIAGTLTMGSTAAMTNAGLLSVANQSNITGVGAVTSGTWHGTPITTAYIGDDQVTEDKLADTLLAEIDANTAKETNVVQTTVSGTSATVTAGTQAAITTCANLTTVGTIGTGTWNGTAIASNYLDSDTAHLSGIQTFIGPRTFAAGIIYDGDRSTTPGDGAAIHVDSSDITDNNTSASGTATAFNHVSIENPRIMASNALVTTTNAATVYIKGAPVASTNQTITNAWALKVAGGNVDISTVTAGTWNGTAIASAYIADDAITQDKLANPQELYIKILPSDFIADDGGRPLAIDDTGSDRWLESHSTNPMFASVEIPAGFKATHVDIYGNGTSAVTVYEANINARAVTSKGTGNIGTQIDITDVTSDATNYLLTQLVQTSGEQVNGGKVTIAAV